LLHPVQARAEWAIFEQRCAAGGDDVEPELLVKLKEGKVVESNDNAEGLSGAILNGAPASTMTTTVSCRPPTRRAVPLRTLSLMPSAFKAYASASATCQDQDLSPTIRTHSCDSLAAVFGAPGLGSVKHKSGTVTPPSESSSSSSSACPSTPSSRLRFHDYLIKPVQRICKYPLMLEGLRSKTHVERADPVVSMAVESMRAVATRVDEARRQKESAARSALIIDRMEPHPVRGLPFPVI
jgi:RhoGEF domain